VRFKIYRKESCLMSQVIDADLVLMDVNLATMDPLRADYGILKQAALAIKCDKIVWLGAQQDLPQLAAETPIFPCRGLWLTPGLIDCHTHLVFGGNRADEFEQRLQGVSYQQIAEQGGGIKRTVAATREASEQSLYEVAHKYATAMMQQGVTCVEIKSGYGLDLDSEIKMLKVARRLGEALPLSVKTSFLGAHAVPTEYAGQPDSYINLVCEQMLPNIVELGLADAVDVFCESIGFSLAQTEKVFNKAQQLGLPVKLHAEQLSNLGGSALAASYKALSVDHIEFLDEAGVKAIAEEGTVATLLPGAFYFLRETQKPPIDLLRKYNVPMAVATDFNPGSSPICSLPLMLNMACTLFSLTPLEALQGVTINGAKALGLDAERGSLTVGKKADLALWDISHPNELSYQFGRNPLQQLWQSGREVSLGEVQ
jgi:imidazolonepropionase